MSSGNFRLSGFGKATYGVSRTDIKGRSRRQRATGALWKPEEDRILLAHVARHGTKKWRHIKSMGLLPTRNHKACCYRFIVLTRKFSRLHQLPGAPNPGAEAVFEAPEESSRFLLTKVPDLAAETIFKAPTGSPSTLRQLTGASEMGAEATIPMTSAKDMAMMIMQRTSKEREDPSRLLHQLMGDSGMAAEATAPMPMASAKDMAMMIMQRTLKEREDLSRLHQLTGDSGMAAEATIPMFMASIKDMPMMKRQRALKERADCDPLSSSSFSDYQVEDARRRSAAQELLESGPEELTEATQNLCEGIAEELLLESGSEAHQSVYRSVAEERFDLATPDFQPGATVLATNRGNVEEEEEEEEEEAADAAAGLVSEEALDSATNEAAQERMLGITTPAVAAATVTIACAPSSPILELNVIETFLLGEMPQQQQQQQPERVFNASSSIQGESVWAPDQDVACATGVNTCATPAGQPGIDNYQCCSVNWDGTAVLSPLADSFPPAPGAGAAQELLPPAAVPPDVVDLVFENSQKPAGAAQEPLPPAAVPSDMVEPGCAVVALADNSDWLAAADNAIASFLIEAELIRINKVLLQTAESAPHSTPLSSSPGSSLAAIQDQGSQRLSSQLTQSAHPNHSSFHLNPMEVTVLTATELLPAMPSTVSMSAPSLLSSQLTHPDHSNYRANPLQVATPTATAQAPVPSTVSMSAPSLLSSQLTHPNPSNFHANPLQVATPTATAQAPMPSTVSMSTPSLLSPVPSYAAATPPSVDPFATFPSVAAAPPAVTPAPASAAAVYSLGCIPFPEPRGREAVSREAVAVDSLGCIFLPEPRSSEAVSMEGCLKPDELFEAWCNGSFTRVLHGF